MEQVLKTYKVYVEVGVKFSAEGDMRPLWIKMVNTGHRYEIDRVRNCVRAASRKAGGCGLRYTVVINRQEANLYFEDDDEHRWFVELKTAL